MSVLEVRNLRVGFYTQKGRIYAVDDVSFSMQEGKTLAIVGESGSGKSVTAMSILRLLDGNGYIESGEIFFQEKETKQNLVTLSQGKMYGIRGNKISMIFQEPMTALNPVLTVKRQVSEPFRIHQNMPKKQAVAAALSMLSAVRIPNPERVLKEYPHQLSGGMRQRIMIAMALACRPKILIADEPTTALDVTIQAQILRLMSDLQRERSTSILFITHDLGVVNEIADDVAVMYCGQIVERVDKRTLFFEREYSHPYTEGLLASTPRIDRVQGRLEPIFGNVPHPSEIPSGCRFCTRCKYRTERCLREMPPLQTLSNNHAVRCFYPKKEDRTSDNHAKLIIPY